MRIAASVLAAGCLLILIPASARAQNDVLQVVPEKCLLAVVTKDADAAETRFRDLAGKLTDQLPEQRFIEQVFQALNVRPQPAAGVKPEPPKDSVIDLKAPLAIVMVPSQNVPGVPFAFVVKTAHYRNLLLELAANLGAAAPEVTPDGTDLVRGAKASLFVAQFGQFGVIGDAEYVVREFKAQAGKSLADSNPASVREVLKASDIAVYVNVDLVMKIFCQDIANFRQMLITQVRDTPARPGLPMTPDKAARMVGAEFDALVELAGQVDASVSGFTFAPDGMRISTHVQMLPDSALAGLAEKLKAGPMDLLRAFDGPALAAAAWNIDPAIVKDVSVRTMDFLRKIGVLDDKNGNKEFIESYQKIMDAAGGTGAFVVAPAGEGKGMVRIVYVIPLKPDVDVRADLRDYLQRSFKLADAFVGAVRIKTKLEAGVETYRDAPVDRLTVTFEKNPDVPEPAHGPDVLKVVESIYGPELVAWITQVGGKLVYTVGYEKNDALKAQVDRVLDAKAGTLLGTEGWKAATEGLPQAQSLVVYLSAAELLRSVAGQFAGVIPADAAKALQDLKLEKVSGLGFSMGPAPKGVVMDCNVPIVEMLNLKMVIMKIQEASAPKPAPAPAPGPAPAPAPPVPAPNK